MANVTFGTPAPYRHVIGDLTTRFYVINGPSGSTLTVPQSDILWVDYQKFAQGGGASVITGISTGANSPSGTVITFTSSGTMVNEVIQVIGSVG